MPCSIASTLFLLFSLSSMDYYFISIPLFPTPNSSTIRKCQKKNAQQQFHKQNFICSIKNLMVSLPLQIISWLNQGFQMQRNLCLKNHDFAMIMPMAFFSRPMLNIWKQNCQIIETIAKVLLTNQEDEIELKKSLDKGADENMVALLLLIKELLFPMTRYRSYNYSQNLKVVLDSSTKGCQSWYAYETEIQVQTLQNQQLLFIHYHQQGHLQLQCLCG